MNRVASFVVLTAGLIVASCSTTAAAPDAGATTDAGTSVDLRIDTYNLGLAGSFVPNESARRTALLSAFGSLDTDVMCVQEAWYKADKDSLVAAAKVKLPYAVQFETNLDTPVTDNKDANGATPPDYTAAPCVDTQATDLTAGLDCLKSKCSTVPDSDDGKTTSTECAKASCALSALRLLGATDKRCYGCLAATLPTSTFKEIREECTTNKHGGVFGNGQNGIVLLSRYPLSNAEQLVLPSTWNRRIVAKATTALPNGADVDLYCTHLTAYFSDTTFFPYTGQYGAGDTNGWIAEQALEATQLAAWVTAKSSGRRAIVMGDLNATPEDKANGIGDGTVPAYGAKTLAALSSLKEAVNASYVPSCTFCVSNANTDGDQNSWIDHIFLSSFQADATLSANRTFDTDAVDGMRRDDTGKHTVAGKVPLSDHYGMHAVVRVTR